MNAKKSESSARSPLISALCAISDEQEMESALRALLTDKERHDIENRLHIVELLQAGLPQRDIANRLGVGVATVTRGAHALKEGHFAALLPFVFKDANHG